MGYKTKVDCEMDFLILTFGCPGTSYVDQAGLELLPAYTSLLASKMCTTSSSLSRLLSELKCHTVIRL